MNVREGTKRIMQAGLGMIFLPPMLMFAVQGLFGSHGSNAWGLLLLAVPGILVVVIAWVIRGFAGV